MHLIENKIREILVYTLADLFTFLCKFRPFVYLLWEVNLQILNQYFKCQMFVGKADFFLLFL